MSLRHSPVYTSKAQASVERWHGLLWAHCRTFKVAIKENYSMDIDVTTPLMCWIVKHASWVQNRYQLHDDGKSSYERRWGTAYYKPNCEFAECVLFQYATTDWPKTSIAWYYGIWLGRCAQSDEHFIGTPTGVYRTRTVRRQPNSDRYRK